MTRDRLQEIARINRVAVTPSIIECMKQAADEAAHEVAAQNADASHAVEIVTPLDCDTCKEKQRVQCRKDFRREVRTLFHLKGWDE